jgi:glucosamine-6-phosphate deaminase
MRVTVFPDAEALAIGAASLVRERVRARPDLVMAVPAGRTPRRMYALLRALQMEDPVDFSRLSVFSVDELCPPAPAAGYFWQQVCREFLAWAGVPVERRHPFQLGPGDVGEMCQRYEGLIAAHGGLDLVMLGLGPNAHLASNEPGAPFESATRPVLLLPETVAYIRTDEPNLQPAGGAVSDRAVTLGLATILAAREVVVLVSGTGKREALGHMLDGPVTPDVPASILRTHPRCTVLADHDARPSRGSPGPTPPYLGGLTL